MSSQKEITREILGYLEAAGSSGLRRSDVLDRLGHVDVRFFKQIFAGLASSGKIVKKRGGRYVCAAARSLFQGIYNASQRGFGFIRPGEERPPKVNGDVFVPAGNTCDAITGDLVQYTVNYDGDSRGPVGKVVKVLEHARAAFVGVLYEEDGSYYVRPMSRELPSRLPLHQINSSPELNGANVGDWVRAEFMPKTDPRAPLEILISKKIAGAATVTGDIKAICNEYGLPNPYTKATEEHAATLQPLEVEREDCRKLDVFTIDPMDARDYDDAISYQRRGKKAVLGIHIADVACFVKRNSPLDRSARRRGFTSYLPGKTIGMLPLALSADLCSLREGVDRLAHSVFLTVEIETGRVLSSRRAHTIIRSGHRLCFEQVDRLLEGEAQPEMDAAFSKKLVELSNLACAMRQRRAEVEQFLPFDSREIRVVCTGKPLQVAGIAVTGSGASSRMIEEFMLAANVAVAQELTEKKIPALYRNHADPGREELNGFAKLAEAFLHRKKVKLNSRWQMVEFLRDVATKPGNEVLNMSLLRCMMRAEYGIANQGHFGLGKGLYCHFTSPIRRYSDLVVHQQLLARDLGVEGIGNDELQEIQMAVNALETNNDYAAFALSDRLKMRLMEERMDANRAAYVECMVTRVVPSGLSLYIPEYGLMAFMPLEFFHGRNWHFDQKKGMFTNGKSSYGFGNVVYARPKTVDAVRGELLMRPVM